MEYVIPVGMDDDASSCLDALEHRYFRQMRLQRIRLVLNRSYYSHVKRFRKGKICK